MYRHRLFMLSLGVAASVACSESKDAQPSSTDPETDSTPDEAEDSGADPVDDGATWHKDVAPILNQNCAGCHNPQGISFDLTDYSQTALLADAVAGATESGQMPPWPPNQECSPLMHERTLTQLEIQTLREWADAGTPQGDPDTAPAAAETEFIPPDEDLTLTLPEPYTPSGATDDYRCFVVDPGFTDTARITGFQVHPDNSAIVHHVLVYTDLDNKAAALDERDDGPGYSCFGGPGFNETAVVGAWAPGSPGYRLPHNTAVSVDAGTPLVVQMHYSPAGDPGGSDQSSVSFDLAEPDEDKRSAFFFPLVDTRLEIPPGASEHVEGFTYTLDYGVDLAFFGGGPHLHRLGTSISLQHRQRESDEFDCVMDIPSWDFNYQEVYFLEEPVVLKDGDEVSLRCVYDNSDDNPYATGDYVYWGDATNDEMCLVYALASLGS